MTNSATALSGHAWAWTGGEDGNSGLIANGDTGLLVDPARTGAQAPGVRIGWVVATDTSAYRGGRAGGPPEADLLVSSRTAGEAGAFTGMGSIDVGGVKVELMELGPAHADGATVVWLPEERVLYTGGLVWSGVHPLTLAGSVANWREVCADLVALRPSIVVPGRGPVTDAGGIVEIRDYLDHLTHEARSRYERGMLVVEAALDLSAGRWERWARPENIVTTVARLYAEFGAEPTGVDPLKLVAEIEQGLRQRPRITPLAPGDRDRATADLLTMTSGETAIFDEHRTNVPNIITTLVRHPKLYEQTVPLARGVVSGMLTGRDRETVILRTAWNCSSTYQWAHHRPMALAAGMSETEVDLLSHPVDKGDWNARETALLNAVDELHARAAVTDRTWRELAAHYVDVEMIEIVTLTGEYHKVAFQVNSWRVPLESWMGHYQLPSGWGATGS